MITFYIDLKNSELKCNTYSSLFQLQLNRELNVGDPRLEMILGRKSAELVKPDSGPTYQKTDKQWSKKVKARWLGKTGNGIKCS